jgi:DNA-binding MarR family transcriptional regulator
MSLSAQPDRSAGPPVVPLDEREDAAWRGVLRAYSALVRELDAELRETHAVTLSGYEVLRFLDDSPEGRLRPGELSDAALLTPSGITRLCDRLGRDGLVTRQACDDDGRGTLIVLTEAGRRRAREARVTHLEGVRRRFLSRLKPAELDTLSTIWRRVMPEPGA